MKPGKRKTLLAALLVLLLGGLAISAVEVVRPGLLRGKLYTAYFVAKAATWDWEYPSGTPPDTRPVDRIVTALLAPEIAQMPAKTWRAPAPEPFDAYMLDQPDDPITRAQEAPPAAVRFAVIGDFGAGGEDARAVADLVKGWEPDFILTTGDNNYPAGEARTIDNNVGQFYHDYIAPYYGRYGPGADQNRFFPIMGNHDWSDNNDIPSPPNAYRNYFTLPPGQGAERYYDFQWGPVHFFALDSDINEPDGITSTSVQGRWLQEKLQGSQAPWKVVYMHHPPYSSSDTHPPAGDIDWPFAEWGASLVMSGHNHFYERIERNNIPYIINGAGGGELYGFGEPTAGSQVRSTGDFGAMLVEAGPCNLQFWFITVDNAVIDTAQWTNAAPACQASNIP